ncbi:uncharacterized protein LOC119834785 [Zerene cesonia]|uniref:uncharacterized protein LOC119834785 n=1 Tax=Zerene cesonia TaxID=33412 RepID=UPI0018E57289|nr:uncharacterized protein LOC119834785 [Zerene cesonia]
MGDNYIKLQDDIFTKIERNLCNYKKSPKERITIGYLETRLEALEKLWSSFFSNHQKIVYEIKKDVLMQNDYTVNEVFDNCEEIYLDYKSLLKDKLLTLKKSNDGSSENKTYQSNVKLPKIEIPKFSGRYSEWPSFRDLFISLIHNESAIDNVQKLHYLKGCLTGEAEQLIRNLSCTAENYSICWQQLENRYNNKKIQANCILKRLTSQKVLLSESSSAIRNLLDTTIECLSALKNLGIDTNSWDIIVIFLISQKLDSESRKQWEQRATETSELPTMTSFVEFLQNRFRSLEYLDPKCIKSEKPTCAHIATSSMNCLFCSENHKLFNCKKFSKETVDSRRSFVQTHHLCFNCLTPNHSVYQCNRSTGCRICRKKHHTLLHTKSPKSASSMQAEQPGEGSTSVVGNVIHSSQAKGEGTDRPILSCFANTTNQVLLATALVKAASQTNATMVVLRSLIDQGSQASFITEAAVQQLGLKKYSETNLMSGLGGDQSSTLLSKSSVVLKIQSRLDPSFVITIKAHVLKKLTTFLPSKKVDIQTLPALTSLQLADPSFHTPSKIDLLLGADVYSQILLKGLVRGPPGTVIAQHTALGWILSGKMHNEGNSVVEDDACNNVVSMHLTQCNENELLKKFWELESESSKPKKYFTLEEENCERLFKETTSRDETGRFIVKLPFKSNNPLCKFGNSKDIARKRFLMLEKRLIKNPSLKIEYSKVIKEYLDLGHMEEVLAEDVDKPNAVYLPHHAVIRQDKTTSKVRVVFDASCKGSNGVSLNDDLMVGPTLQPELRHLLMRWRCYPISLVADIVKMYRQVKVAESDTDYQRILWRDDPNDDLRQFRLLRVTFGTSSAPYLAVRTLQELVHMDGEDFPLASTRILKEFYMDDLMSGCHTVDEGVQIYEEMIELLKRGGFPLQKFSSNNKELLKEIKAENSESDHSMEIKIDEVMKILGLTWNREEDRFHFTVKLSSVESPITKRKVISDIARLFDPLGWIAPVVTKAKIFIQQLWLSGIEWDSELPKSLLKDWLGFRNDLKSLAEVRISRWIRSSLSDQCLELHGFCDASNAAFAAVVYARIIDNSGNVHVNLVTSKTRVAPVKQISIPRLELCGAVLLARLLDEVSLVLEVPKHQTHAWTDSSIVLAWLRSHPSRWKTFIANRVSEIHTLLNASQWSHVVSKENPADCASRGLSATEFIHNDLWKLGPKWLYRSTIDYSKGEDEDTNLEERKHKISSHTVTSNKEDNIISRFSSLRKLTRVLSFCRRVLHWNKPEKEKNISKILTAKEIQETLLICIKICQREHYDEEIENLKNNEKLSKKSKLTSLNPFLGRDGVLRVGGRLHNAALSDDMKHPIIIPHKSHLTYLLIHDAHERTLHGGPQLVLNYLRSKYWIVGAKSAVKQFIKKCVTCIRHSAQVNQQMMGQLPVSRVTAHRPFLRSGVDYAGPISIRTTKGRGHHATKGYICLFICMATRAIHLEVVSDMTSETFLAAFKRFVARRGHVTELWSDNGTTFVGSARELKNLLQAERSTVTEDILDYLSCVGTTWHFIPPRAPNFGGLWEAGVKSTKYHLKRVVGDKTLTYEELSTVLAQVEACLNSRPLTQLSSNPEDPQPLTPAHFLVGEPLVTVPDANYERSNISSLKRWQLAQRMVQDFWRRWSREYLTQLHQRYKWKVSIPEPEIGSVVLVKEDDLPPNKWLFGLIVDKHPGLDNLTRVVTLKYKGHFIKRPVSKLIVLPINS